MVKTPPSIAESTDSIRGQGTKVPHAVRCSQKAFFKTRKKYIVNKSDKSHEKCRQLEEPHDRFGPGKEELGRLPGGSDLPVGP